jgi:hypothetical protein
MLTEKSVLPHFLPSCKENVKIVPAGSSVVGRFAICTP